MGYQDEWLLLEAEDDLDEVEHRPPTEEFLFYQAVTNGDLDAVRENCEQERFLDSEGVGVLSRNPVTNLKYHFVITTAMVTRLCKQKGMEPSSRADSAPPVPYGYRPASEYKNRSSGTPAPVPSPSACKDA